MSEKMLHEMSTDEIAALSPEEFKRRADAYHDHSELRENARNREIEAKEEARREAMRELLDLAEKMAGDEFKNLPRVNDMRDGDLGKPPIMHGIPHPEDPANPYEFRKTLDPTLNRLVEKAWGMSHTDAVAIATKKWERSEHNPANYPASSGPADSSPLLHTPDEEIDRSLDVQKPCPPPKFDPRFAVEVVAQTAREMARAVPGMIQNATEKARERRDSRRCNTADLTEGRAFGSSGENGKPAQAHGRIRKRDDRW